MIEDTPISKTIDDPDPLPLEQHLMAGQRDFTVLTGGRGLREIMSNYKRSFPEYSPSDLTQEKFEDMLRSVAAKYDGETT